MMGSSDYWTRRVLTSSTLCILIVLQTTYAQEGFRSIQCCADTNFTESTTNISWVTDDNWYPDKLTCQGTAQQIKNTTFYAKTRVFNSRFAKKWCYDLTTRKDQDYLIRGTFTAGDLRRTPQSTIFDVLIDVTSVAHVNSSNDAVVEGVFRTTTENMNFCLLKEHGDPYLSRLELRPLASNYLVEKASTVLKLIDRIDVGNTGTAIRYPYDPYDRIWRPQPDHVHSGDVTRLSLLNIVITPTSTLLPPTQVLQTAITHPERLEFLHNNLDTGYYTYNLYIYFFEHNKSVQAGQRVIDIYINNEKQQEVDILSVGSSYRAVELNFKANGVLNLTLIKTNGSQLGPICNAYEILQVRPQLHGTTQEDVDTIMDVKNDLLVDNQDNKVLRSWYGDPCLPLPWDGLFCTSSDGSSVITKLNLSFKNLQGPLPPSISKMRHLRELNMSNNKFSRVVPAFPASSILTSVDLSHNNLRGKVPESLASLRQLTTLSFGCNQHMSRKLPESLNRSKLDTDEGTCHRKRSSTTSKGIVIGTVTGGLLFVVVAGVFCYCLVKKRVVTRGKFDRGHSMTKNAIYSIRSMDDISVRSINIQNFSLENIEAATQRYKTLIGEGGFGSVYRGTLTDGQEVAVKVRSATSTQGTREFNNELNLLSAIRHENLVPLLGYCYEKDQQILVYPFMSNGSLQDRLYGEAATRKTLDWPTRLSIALGAARGKLHKL
ncbi:Symbiosis receptor-like kinase [Heracleum sosnowskyi]|uniref:non-specific serine/threonine protein kinase n=1 Tax=Heracleum sosnowskyi TaxID=360622 RepID=A0AAD8LWI3_9APIA|nr:Symbiosis receptor-like kinase [Heracleum sosnowskyi]